MARHRRSGWLEPATVMIVLFTVLAAKMLGSGISILTL